MTQMNSTSCAPFRSHASTMSSRSYGMPDRLMNWGKTTAPNRTMKIFAVVIAASAAYSTPVSTPVVTLVVEPGRYRFMDFVKVGVPLLLVTYLVTVLLAPIVFPFDGFQWP